MFDELDFLLIDKLQEDARKPVAQLARELGRPTATVRDRLRRLEAKGVILEYTTVIDVAKIGFPIKAVVHVNTSGRSVDPEAFLSALGQIREVASARLITGSYEAEVTVYVQDIKHLSSLLYEDLHQIPGVTGTNTSIVLLEQRWHTPRGIASLPPEPA
jgi:Lrp/AsnC family leucine-responsive transcriptional regulator